MSFAGIIRESLTPYNGATLAVLTAVLIRCNHTDNLNYNVDNLNINIKRGQWVGSQQKLSNLTGLSRQSIRTALQQLKQPKRLTSKSTSKLTNKMPTISTSKLTSKATLYTIENIDYFLVKENHQPADQPAKQISVNQQANQRITTNNNEYTNKKEKITKRKNSPEFDLFWQNYPRKVAKAKADDSFKKAINNGAEPQAIITGAKKYAQLCEMQKTETKFIAHPATWLNSERWNDDYSLELKTTTKQKRTGYTI